MGSAVQTACRGPTLDRGWIVRAIGAGKGRHALDTERRSSTAAVREAGRAGVPGGSRRDPVASTCAGRVSPCRGPGFGRCPARPGTGLYGTAVRPSRAADALLPAAQIDHRARRFAGAHHVLAGRIASGAGPRQSRLVAGTGPLRAGAL